MRKSSIKKDIKAGEELLFLLFNNKRDDEVYQYLENNLNCDVTLIDSVGNTALKYATNRGYLKTSKKLLELGADPNKKNFHDADNLYYPIKDKNIELIKLLLEYGANINFLYQIASTKGGLGPKVNHIETSLFSNILSSEVSILLLEHESSLDKLEFYKKSIESHMSSHKDKKNDDLNVKKNSKVFFNEVLTYLSARILKEKLELNLVVNEKSNLNKI